MEGIGTETGGGEDQLHATTVNELSVLPSSLADGVQESGKNEIRYQDISSELVYSSQSGPLSILNGLSLFLGELPSLDCSEKHGLNTEISPGSTTQQNGEVPIEGENQELLTKV